MKQKSFIAISSTIYKNKLVYLYSSSGESLFNQSGIKFDKAIEFLFDLIKHRRKQKGIVFVNYNFALTNEFLFSTMPSYLRHKLFQSDVLKDEVQPLEDELEQLNDIYYSVVKDSQAFEQADFERFVLKHAINEALEVKYQDYKITLRQGKMLTISKKGKAISIYDCYGFFKSKRQTLRESYKIWLGKDIPALDKGNFTKNPFLPTNEIKQLKIFAQIEAQHIKELITVLDNALQNENINLTRYYGASCIISHLLNKWKAKDSFHNYRHRRQMSKTLWEAVNSAFYGGRIEQQKLGTLQNVKVYDINSAYAYAGMFLPLMHQKPYFTREWKAEPFSLWYCEYDFTKENLYLGLLPFRVANNSIKFPLKASGWFWQPELAHVLEHYPHCVEVKHGFILPYKQVSFADDIYKFYNRRLELTQNNNPLSKVFKETLSNINGRFSQKISKQRYYNLFYAGFVTSITRRQLLEAVKGNEKETICFQTDAIHTTAALSVNISNEIGQFKVSHYDSILYLDNGVYQAFEKGELQKIKTRGLKQLDFDNALSQMQNTYSYEAESNVFIGHNLFTAKTFRKAEYLENFDVDLRFSPPNDIDSRTFEKKKINLLNEFLDSKPIAEYHGKSKKHNQSKFYYQIMDSLKV